MHMTWRTKYIVKTLKSMLRELSYNKYELVTINNNSILAILL